MDSPATGSPATNSDPHGASGVVQTLEALRQEISYLHQRVAQLETSLATGTPVAGDAEDVNGMSEELLLVLSGAVAAFLGEKPHIRQIRLLGGTSWMQQGRATIQASHTLSVKHG